MGKAQQSGWSYRTADAPGTSLRFVIETHQAVWDRYAIQDDEGTRGDWVCHEPGYRRVAMTTDGGPEAERDAAILASAPDLLAACERSIIALAANGAPNCEAVKECRAAIAKAKGNQPPPHEPYPGDEPKDVVKPINRNDEDGYFEPKCRDCGKAQHPYRECGQRFVRGD